MGGGGGGEAGVGGGGGCHTSANETRQVPRVAGGRTHSQAPWDRGKWPNHPLTHPPHIPALMDSHSTSTNNRGSIMAWCPVGRAPHRGRGGAGSRGRVGGPEATLCPRGRRPHMGLIRAAAPRATSTLLQKTSPHSPIASLSEVLGLGHKHPMKATKGPRASGLHGKDKRTRASGLFGKTKGRDSMWGHRAVDLMGAEQYTMGLALPGPVPPLPSRPRHYGTEQRHPAQAQGHQNTHSQNTHRHSNLTHPTTLTHRHSNLPHQTTLTHRHSNLPHPTTPFAFPPPPFLPTKNAHSDTHMPSSTHTRWAAYLLRPLHNPAQHG